MSMERYASLRHELEEATAARTRMIGMLHEAVKGMLANPELFHLTNCSGSVGFPMEVIGSPIAPTFNAANWPTAQQIQEVFVRWHAARERAHAAWLALSDEQQKVLQPPI